MRSSRGIGGTGFWVAGGWKRIMYCVLVTAGFSHGEQGTGSGFILLLFYLQYLQQVLPPAPFPRRVGFVFRCKMQVKSASRHDFYPNHCFVYSRSPASPATFSIPQPFASSEPASEGKEGASPECGPLLVASNLPKLLMTLPMTMSACHVCTLILAYAEKQHRCALPHPYGEPPAKRRSQKKPAAVGH